MQNYIRNNRSDTGQRWIFDIIHGAYRPTEIILRRTDKWTLCRDAHNIQSRWLVVFYDKTLNSIRDLRGDHVNMLLESQRECQRVLMCQNIINDTHKLEFFFHYMPSVYQLHMHVYAHNNSISNTKPHIRRHSLHQIVRNLSKDSDYYLDALILTTLPKTLKNVVIFDTVFDHLEGIPPVKIQWHTHAHTHTHNRLWIVLNYLSRWFWKYNVFKLHARICIDSATGTRLDSAAKHLISWHVGFSPIS